MKREIRETRDKLRIKSKSLRNAKFDGDIKNKDTVARLIKEQDEVYKRFLFFDKIIEANEKVKQN